MHKNLPEAPYCLKQLRISKYNMQHSIPLQKVGTPLENFNLTLISCREAVMYQSFVEA